MIEKSEANPHVQVSGPLKGTVPSGHFMRRWARRFGYAAGWLCLALALLWAFGALWFDFPLLRKVVALLLPAGAAAAFYLIRPWLKAMAVVAGACALVLAWWLTLQPRQDRDWRADAARTASITLNGENAAIHNLRNFNYRSETDYTPVYEDRNVDLRKLRGVDLFICYWGSPYMAHPILSFDFGDDGHVCFSIETRPEKGESYSALGGLYRQFELMVIVADESDVIRLRTNFRQGEDVYHYRLKTTPELARASFLEYVATVNGLDRKPRWYNAVTNNCTTAIRNQRTSSERAPWDWRMLVNGLGDEWLYERGAIERPLPFPELKRAAHINPRARLSNDALDFSARIRGR